ncbi:hypothetical protein L1987_12576 [Smallanthus sonchifolius]|uniref:Uncharacterized protein n=1 Tax=Smallanthus sonchifolius TaxID=185202 RepID=A0ACB9JEK5_9ASTR|nr:hypothetical protein L1987_12576 [Smallanthus sonchifolius]
MYRGSEDKVDCKMAEKVNGSYPAHLLMIQTDGYIECVLVGLLVKLHKSSWMDMQYLQPPQWKSPFICWWNKYQIEKIKVPSFGFDSSW